MELPLLRTLVFFVTESHPGSMGFIDKSASVGIVSNTMGRTKTPKYRDLRTLEGIEYIYALRGLESVQFYDLRPTAQLGRRFGVRDSLFVDAVNNVVTMTRQSAECPGHWHSQIAKEESETDGPAVSVEPQDRTTWLVENAWNHVYRLYKNSHLRTRPDADPIGPGNLNTSYQNTDGNQEDPIIKNQLRDLPVVASIFQNIGRNVHNEDVALRSSCSHPGADAPVTDERKVYSDTTPSALSQRAVQNLATGLYNCPTDSSHSTHSHTSASDDHLRDFAELLRESSQPLANPGAVTDCHGRERSTSGDSLFVAGPLSISLLGQGNDGE
ncbi:hypothetical protein VTK73DRAFT_5374 [Phialemonium thermophilum]|uniref:Uncharacterized protein n=1 Tax=Phialemonium thermophilum TaxID=223376 RepID=A0ABR3XX48_9PEZI